MSIPFTAAVVHVASVPSDSMATAEKAADRLREAAGKGARLVVFPEALIGGYPKGASFGPPSASANPRGGKPLPAITPPPLIWMGERYPVWPRPAPTPGSLPWSA